MSDAVTIARNDLAVNEAMDGLRVELINRARIIAFDPAVTERLDALIATTRRAALIEAAEMLEFFAVNLGASGEIKPLIPDPRNGKVDAVRQSYAHALRALAGEQANV